MKGKIELAGKAYPLLPPSGIARLDLQLGFPGNDASLAVRVRWGFGALALCWQDKPLGWPVPSACKYDLIALGEQVYAGLEAAGLRPEQHAMDVYNAMVGVLNGLVPSEGDAKAAKDFP